MKVSIWLLTPPSLHVQLNTQIAFLAEKCHGPKFDSHVTLFGGLRCESKEELDRMCHMLKCHLEDRYAEGIPCRFVRSSTTNEANIVSCYHTNAITGEQRVQWNQACVSIMEPHDNPEYMKLRRSVLDVLLSDTTHMSSSATQLTPDDFPPPVRKPHYSYFYGTKAPSNDTLSEISGVPDFSSTQIAIWYTDPPTVDGVVQWYEVMKINLCSTTDAMDN